MSGFEVRSVEIAAGEDHDGDPVLFVEVNHDLSGTPVDPRILSSLVVQIRNELAEAGETRFPLIRHHFAEKQKVVGFP